MFAVCVLNVGSSSIKYRVLDAISGKVFASGMVERIGEAGSGIPDHQTGITRVLADISEIRFVAVGHRVVHGGTRFTRATPINDEVEQEIASLAPLAPLHNPPSLAGIRQTRSMLPGVPQVAVFDTAFHASLPPAAYDYALNAEVSAKTHIRKFGFHGSSYSFVSRRAAEMLGRQDDPDFRLIVLHLGNGASAAAIRGGVSVDTSMGFTPLQGLVMGTRSGDIDPAIPLFLQREQGLSIDQVDNLLNKSSGLLGLAGVSDMRELVEKNLAGQDQARHALDVYIHRIRHYLGAYAAILGGLDALVFTAGVGENSAYVRQRVTEGLEFLGMAIDPERNAKTVPSERIISQDSPAQVLVVPTNEEFEIARETWAVLTKHN